MNLRYGPAQRSPPALIQSERNRLLPVPNEVSAQNGSHPGGGAGLLKLD